MNTCIRDIVCPLLTRMANDLKEQIAVQKLCGFKDRGNYEDDVELSEIGMWLLSSREKV